MGVPLSPVAGAAVKEILLTKLLEDYMMGCSWAVVANVVCGFVKMVIHSLDAASM